MARLPGRQGMGGVGLPPPIPDGIPMRRLLVIQANALARLIREIRALRYEHNLGISAACRSAGVSRQFYYDHRQEIEKAKPRLSKVS